MNETIRPPMATGSAERAVCRVSRRRGWVDEKNRPRPASEANLLAIAIGAPVWTIGTAWESIFHRAMPRDVHQALSRAMVRARLTEADVGCLRRAAEWLGVALEVFP